MITPVTSSASLIIASAAQKLIARALMGLK
jgi:hypothetical protein